MPDRSDPRIHQIGRFIPWLWLGLSAVWAVVIIVTEQLAWPLALWIATTVGPLTYLQSRDGGSTSSNPNN